MSIWAKPGVPASWDWGVHAVAVSKLMYWLQRGVYPLQFPEFLFGMPFLHFYSPLFFLVTAAIGLMFSLDPMVSVKMSLALSFILTAITTYYIYRKISDNRQGAIVASVGFTFSGYHITNILSQGMFPASFAFVFLPLIFGYYHLSARDNRLWYSVYAGFALGLMILSHLVTAYITAVFLSLLVVIRLILNLISFDRKAFLSSAKCYGLVLASSIPVSTLFLEPFLKDVGATFLGHNISPFATSLEAFIDRAVPIDRLFLRYPPNFDGGIHIPLYIGTLLTILAVIGIKYAFKRPFLKMFNEGKDGGMVFFAMVLFLTSIIFCLYPRFFAFLLFPLGGLGKFLMLKIYFPQRVTFLISYSASILAGYFVTHLSQLRSLPRLADRLNLNLDLSNLITLCICLLLMLDSSIYFLNPSPFNYQTTFPPYGSTGMEQAYRWVSHQEGLFRTLDPLGGSHERLMLWDNIIMITSLSDPNFAPYSENTLQTVRLVEKTDDTKDDIMIKGYFGVKYAIAHLYDPKEAFSFANTSWIPVTHFYEVWIFRNPYFRAIAVVTDDPQNINATETGIANISHFDPHRVEINVDGSGGFLTFKFFFSPDFQCRLDGDAIKILENHYGFMYLPVSEGRHKVIFTYGDQHMIFYLLNLTVALLVVSFYVLIRLKKARLLSVKSWSQPSCNRCVNTITDKCEDVEF